MAKQSRPVVTLSPEDWRRLVEIVRRVANMTPGRPVGGRRPLAPENKFLAVLDDDLSQSGSATATVWSYDPEADATTASELQIEVRGWLLPDDQILPSGSHIVVELIGAAYQVVASRECPEDES